MRNYYSLFLQLISAKIGFAVPLKAWKKECLRISPRFLGKTESVDGGKCARLDKYNCSGDPQRTEKYVPDWS